MLQDSTNESEGDLGQDIIFTGVGARLSIDGSCGRLAGYHLRIVAAAAAAADPNVKTGE